MRLPTIALLSALALGACSAQDNCIRNATHEVRALDALIAASPPHYSQQFRERYMPQPFAP